MTIFARSFRNGLRSLWIPLAAALLLCYLCLQLAPHEPLTGVDRSSGQWLHMLGLLLVAVALGATLDRLAAVQSSSAGLRVDPPYREPPATRMSRRGPRQPRSVDDRSWCSPRLGFYSPARGAGHRAGRRPQPTTSGQSSQTRTAIPRSAVQTTITFLESRTTAACGPRRFAFDRRRSSAGKDIQPRRSSKVRADGKPLHDDWMDQRRRRDRTRPCDPPRTHSRELVIERRFRSRDSYSAFAYRSGRSRFRSDHTIGVDQLRARPAELHDRG